MERDYRKHVKAALDFLFGPNRGVVVDQKMVIIWLKDKGVKDVSTPGLSRFKGDLKKLEEHEINPPQSDADRIFIGIDRYLHWSNNLDYFIMNSLGYKYIEERNWFEKDPDIEVSPPSPVSGNGKVVIHNGRLHIAAKVALVKNARHEIIEVGVRLRTFAHAFNHNSDSEYQDYFAQALKRGVNVKCYILDPKCDNARNYFTGRAKAEGKEAYDPEIAERVIEELKGVGLKFRKLGYTGRFEVFIYDCFPHNHFLAIDGGTPDANMAIALYAYGIPRSKCPVIQFNRTMDPYLYDIYWKSLQYVLGTAKAVPIE